MFGCKREKITILAQMSTNKNIFINNNSYIYIYCKCRSKFHKFLRNVTKTLRTRLTQKKVASNRRSKKVRLTLSPQKSPPILCQSIGNSPGSASVSSQETASPPVFLIDTNVPGLLYRSPCANPTNLELAQRAQYLSSNPNFEV